MGSKLFVDEAGRVALPQQLRDQLRLKTGDALEIEASPYDDGITLRPVRDKVELENELGIPVFPGVLPQNFDLLEFLNQEREKRLRDIG